MKVTTIFLMLKPFHTLNLIETLVKKIKYSVYLRKVKKKSDKNTNDAFIK